MTKEIKINWQWLNETFQDRTSGTQEFYNLIRKVCLFDRLNQGIELPFLKDHIDLVQETFKNLEDIEIEVDTPFSNKDVMEILSNQKIRRIQIEPDMYKPTVF